jgi:hypothetical protein
MTFITNIIYILCQVDLINPIIKFIPEIEEKYMPKTSW